MKTFFCAVFFVLSVFPVKAQTGTDSVKSAKDYIIEQEKNRKGIPNTVGPQKIELKKEPLLKDSGNKAAEHKKCIFRKKKQKRK